MFVIYLVFTGFIMTHVADGHKIDTTTLRRHFMHIRKIFQGKDKFYSSLLKIHRLGLSDNRYLPAFNCGK